MMNQNNSREKKEKMEQNFSQDELSRAQDLFVDKKLDENINAFDFGKDREDFDSALIAQFQLFLSGRFQKLAEDFEARYDGANEEGRKRKEELLKSLKMKIVASLVPRNNMIKKLTGIFKKEFQYIAPNDVVEEKKEWDKFEEILSKMDNDVVDGLIRSEVKREGFVKKNFVKNNELIFTKINPVEIDQKLETLVAGKIDITQLTADQKEALIKLNQTYTDVSFSEMKEILNIFSSKRDKLLLMQIFTPYLTIEKLEKLGVVNKEEVKKVIKKSVEDKLGVHTYDDSFVNEIVDRVDYRQIYLDLSTEDINGDLVDVDDLASAIEKEINELKKELRKSELGDFWEKINIDDKDKNIHTSFLKYIEGRGDIDISIRDNIHKFKEGSFLVIKRKDSPDLIVEVAKVDDGTLEEGKKVIFLDRSATGGMRKKPGSIPIPFSYVELQSIFTAVTKTPGTDVVFYTDDEMKDIKPYKEVVDIFDVDENDNLKEGINNKDDLKNAFDIFDYEGQGIPFDKDEMVLYYDKEGANYIVTIDEITESGVFVEGQFVDFNSFFASCRKNNLKRRKKIKNEGDFLTSLSALGGDLGKIYEKLEMGEHGKFTKHDNHGEESNIFVGEDGTAIWFEELHDGHIKINFGKYEEKGDKKEFNGEYYYTNLDQAFADISRFKMSPVFEKAHHGDGHGDHEHGEHDDDHHHPHPHFHGSFMAKYLSFLSVHDVVHAMHQIAHSIEHSFGHGSHLKSAKAARAIGNLLPIGSHLKGDLQATVEKEERKIRDEIMDNLKARGSKDMLATIEHILHDKNIPQYEVEAAILTVLSKYGTLYPKQLSYMRGDFYWYERLGGKVGDKMYNEAKQECEDSLNAKEGKGQPIPFTEEYLIEKLLSEHAKKGIRESRIDKIYGNAIAEGIRTEKEDGETKAGNKNTSKGKVDYVVGELKNGGYANAIGGLPKIFSKNGPMVDLHAVPFILTMSGMSKNFEQRLLNDIGGMAFTTPYTSLGFSLKPHWNEIYKNAMLEIAKSLDEEKNEGIEADLKAAMSDTSADDKLSKEGNIVANLKKFWDKHGTKMVNRLTLKDHYIMAHKGDNEALQKYYSVMKGIQSDDGDFNPKNEYIEELWFKNTPVTYTGALLSENDITADPSGDFRGSVSRKNAEMYVNTLEDLKKSNYSEEQKKAIFKEVYEKFESKMNRLLSYHVNKKSDELMTIPIYKFLKSKGLIVSTEKTYKEAFGDDYEKFLDAAWDTFYNHKSKGDATESKIEVVKKGTAEGVMKQFLTGEPLNDETSRKRA